ncbi:glycosyltransferase family 4 protein [Arthrobacter sp. RT-1]|uniref:glycosyltransferase family 4 protein n=1 Tax=Arthrobacter sp. RT-1 TaxID=2292263 RepID=UPI0015F13FE8|nr:glycosyltransferase [Arthrobacter sp. RT-1]
MDLAQHKPFPPLALGSHLAVGYAGSLSEAKDGVLTLLAAVAKAKPKLAPKLVLQVHILGDVQSSHGQLAVERVRDLGIEEEVTFHGLVPHLDVKNYLHKCHLLVLPRPDSRQARGGFPTKLGEYLSSARPVMTTSVGDIPQFLTDQENCLMVTPGDEDLMASTLVYVTENYELAVKIGRRGREVVERLFDARLQAREAVNFLNGLSDNG